MLGVDEKSLGKDGEGGGVCEDMELVLSARMLGVDKKLSDGDGAISSWAITFMNVNGIFTNITNITTFMAVDLFIAILIL